VNLAFFFFSRFTGRETTLRQHHIIYLTKNLAPITSGDSTSHGLIYTPSKMSSSKKLTCKGTLRPVFIRVYRLEIQSVTLVFSSQLCELLPFSMVQLSSLPPFRVWINILYTRVTVCKGYGVLSLRHINTSRKVPFQIKFC